MRARASGRRGPMLGAALLLLTVISVMPASAAAATGTRSPLPASDYSVRPVCGAPLPGHAGCLADRLVPVTAAARSHSHPLGVTLPRGAETEGSAATAAYGLRPEDLHEAYDLPLDAPDAQTIGIVDAYDDPTAEEDLQVYDEEFGLPACTTANGCFRKVNQRGETSSLPEANTGWQSEISLDVQTAHAICQNCHILLVEAASSSFGDFGEAEDTAVAEGATEISNSYAGGEGAPEYFYDYPGVVITAATGDWGYDNWSEPIWGDAANYPASLPSVVAVSGTSLELAGGEWAGETAWSLDGSGCSEFEAAPSWQSAVPDWAAVGCGSRRATADVAADADPYTGVAIYDSGEFGWGTWGGTSLSSPIIAATFALAGGSHGVAYPAQTLYAHLGTSSLHDVVSGSDWGCPKARCTIAEEEANCAEAAICNAGPGYDGPTGVGTPDGLTAFGSEPPGPPPTVTSVSPARGSVDGGETVTIRGTRLKDAERVRFGNSRATILADGEEESITVEAPPGEPGLADVTVTSSEGLRSATSDADRYEYVVAQPSVSSIEPNQGAAAGGEAVTIRGTNLEDAEYVEFGGSYAWVERATANSITTTSPEHEPGPVDVTVVGPYGVTSNATAADVYTYLAPSSAQLTIETTGSGKGVVFVWPSGTACESICSEAFAEGSTATLSAAPMAGSAFRGWSGAGCSGTGMCAVTLSGDATVTAIFESTGSGGFGGGVSSGGAVTSGSSSSGSTASNAASAAGGDPPGSQGGGDGSGSDGSCVLAARRAFQHARRAAKRATGKARAAALKRARRRERHRLAACRT